MAAVCLAAALISACGGQAAKHQAKRRFSTLAREAPTRPSGTSAGTASTAGGGPSGTTTSSTPAAGPDAASATTTGATPGATTGSSFGTPSTVLARDAALKKRLRRALAHAGPQVGLMVVDLGSGQTLDSLNPSVARPPASVEKLYTTVAALDLLGPSTRLQTTVLGKGTLERRVWHGNLYLRGGGDPTLGDGSWNQTYEGGHGPTAQQLARRLTRDGIRRVTGHIFADPSLFDADLGGPATKDLPDTPDYGGEMSALVYDHGMSTGHMSPAVFAAHELALTLRGEGVRVAAAGRTAQTPAAAEQLAVVSSPPVSVLMRLMDVPSDDLIADMVAKQLGARLLGKGTLLGGADEIRQAIATNYRLHPTILDGSGLDHDDSSTPEQLVTLLRESWNTRIGELLYRALPVVGRQGTVESLGLHSPAAGRCVAKTGTLDNVTNLAGYCRARDRRELAFAVMIDGPSNYLAWPMLSRVVAAVARY